MRNAISTEPECTNDGVRSELAQLDIGRGSILHYLFTRPPIQKTTFLKSYLIPCFIVALLFYGFPLLIVWIKVPNILIRNTDINLDVGFLDDWNVLLMYLVTLPAIVSLTLSQRSMIPDRIASIMQGASPITEKYDSINSFVSSWNERFKVINLIGQFAGVIVAVAVVLVNYYGLTTDSDFKGWQSTDCNINIAGWVLLCWQLPLFYWITSVFVSQVLAVITLLFRLTQNFKIKVFPFHHDNCCGLRKVGQIGLRNQYLLAVVGINLLALLAVNIKREDSDTAILLLIAAAAAYIIFGPLVFLGPLLPFRERMLSVKEKEQAKVAKKLQHEYTRIMAEDGPMTKEDGEMLDVLQKLKVLVNRIPVWPFDISTLRRFVTAYVLPFLTSLVYALISYAITALKGISSTVQQ